MAEEKTERWTEIEHLPEWDEEFYYVYTAKKFGKWVMLKTLRPEYENKPEQKAMIEKEFDVRYNLAHPNIVMINDFEDVPGIGRCIITDDVYGLSFRKLLNSGKVTEHHVKQITHQLVDALQYIQANHIVHHRIRPETIIFTENIENLKLIDVGFDQKSNLSQVDVYTDIYDYGMVLKQALDAAGISDLRLHRVAERCIHPNPQKRYHSVEELRLAVDGRSNSMVLLIVLSTFIALMCLILFLIRQ